MSDVDLLNAWALGDGDAGNQLIERHFVLLYRFFRNKSREADVEDLVQQTFMACLEARERYDGRASLVTYLLAIARNLLFSYYRARRREPLEVGFSSLCNTSTTPTGALAKIEDEQLLLDALRNVPLEAQIVLELAYREGLTGPEIAEVLGVAAGTVHTRLHRARDCLRESVRALAPDRIALADDLGSALAHEA